MNEQYFDLSRWENWSIVAILVLAVAMIVDTSKER